MKKNIVIIGAGPAGLTAGYELLKNSCDYRLIIIEKDIQPGGISKTMDVNGFLMDLGGHRFFSKSRLVMDWWFNILPPAGSPAEDDLEIGRELPLFKNGPDPSHVDDVFLIRKRQSSILFEKKFFPYPLELSLSTLKKLGITRSNKILFDYLCSKACPRRPEKTLEDFLINRFGQTLFNIFFKDYTEKVWGRSCNSIDASWGRQRIKGLSLTKIFSNLLKSSFSFLQKKEVFQLDKETSLINYFLYPKYGPGHLWKRVAEEIQHKGGKIIYQHQVKKIFWEDNRITGMLLENTTNGTQKVFKCNYCISSAPLSDLIRAMDPPFPANIASIGLQLPYRDFITIGVCLDEAKLPKIYDNWIYIQERDVKLGRIQLFHNWSPYLVPHSDVLWLGLEYFTSSNDEFWYKSNQELIRFAIEELKRLEIITHKKNVIFAKVIRVEKAYPGYWGSYSKFSILRSHLDKIQNLFLVGRNGMHRYNNQDHSMLTAIEATKNIIAGYRTKDNIWMVNSDENYHESRKLT